MSIPVNVDVISPATNSPQSLVLGHSVEGHGKHNITPHGPVRLFIWATHQTEEVGPITQALMLSLWFSLWVEPRL